MKKLIILLTFLSYSTFGKFSESDTIKQLNILNLSYKKIPYASLKYYKSPQERNGQNPKLALGLCLSGGGSRAQYFSTGVMIGLDDISCFQNNSVLKEVDYFSTVSGGGFAAGNYIALLKKGVLNNFVTFSDYWKSTKHYSKKYNESLNIGTSKINLILKFGRKRLNYSNIIDKRVLLNSIAKANKNNNNEIYLNTILISKDSSEKYVKYPYLIANASIYTNGDLFPLMPHIIDSLCIKSYYRPRMFLPIAKKVRSRNLTTGFPLQYALGTSAAFPGMLPVYNYSPFKVHPRRNSTKSDRIIKAFDGGLIDNLGVETMSNLLKTDIVSDDYKKTIVVNNSGTSTESAFTDAKNLRLFKFLKKSSLYAVNININTSKLGLAKRFGDKNFIYLGLGDYKDFLNEIEKNDIQKSANNLIEEKITWVDVETKLVDSLKRFNVGSKISTIPKYQFSSFKTEEILYLFELACNVETKLRVRKMEREILVLAGRYMVYRNENELKKLLN